MEKVNSKTIPVANDHKLGDTTTERKRATTPEPASDSIVFCDENGACSCFNPLIAYVASLFSSCLAFIQGLLTAAPAAEETPVVSPEVAAVASFHKKWSSGVVPATKQPEWAKEFSALCDEAKAAAMQAFGKRHPDAVRFLTAEDEQYIESNCSGYARLISTTESDAQRRATHLQLYRNSRVIECAICRCQGHPTVLLALLDWRIEQQQHT